MLIIYIRARLKHYDLKRKIIAIVNYKWLKSTKSIQIGRIIKLKI